MKRILVTIILVSHFTTLAQNYKFGKVSKEELEEQFYPLDSTAAAAYLYKYKRTYYDYVSSVGFQLTTEVTERIKIYTKEGFDYATESIRYYSPEIGDKELVASIKGYTYSLEEGEIIKQKLTKENIFKEKLNEYRSVKKITMPNIKEGVVIEFKYKIISPYEEYLSDLNYQYNIPVKKLHYQVEIPEFFIFNKRSKGYYSVPVKQESKMGSIGGENFNTNVFKFDGENIPPLKDDEPYVASIYDYRGGMKFELTQINFIAFGGAVKTFSNTWKDVSKQIYKSPSFGEQLKKSHYYKEDLEQILASAKTEVEQTYSIFEFVKNKIKWNGRFGKYAEKGVRTAFKERVGNVADINLMLTSMLRSAGLNANPVLVSSKSNGIPMFPTLDGFNYVISMVEFSDNTYVLLDASEPYSSPNMLPARALNWNGRKVTKGGNSSSVRLESAKPAIEENNINIHFSEDLLIEGSMRSKFDNFEALTYRKEYNAIKEESIIEKLEEENNLEIDGFRVSNAKKIGKPIIRQIQFISEDLVEEINGKVYIEPLLFLSHHENPFKLEERNFPIDFITAKKNMNIVSIQIPDGYKVVQLPENIAIGLPDNLSVFKFQITQVGNKINTMCVLHINKPLISANYYPYLKDFYSQMVKKESEKIVLEKI